MTIEFSLAPTHPDAAEVGLLVVPVYEGGDLGPGADALDGVTPSGLAAFCEQAGYEAKRGRMLAVPVGEGVAAEAAVVVGLGKREDLDVETFRRVGAAIARRSRKHDSVATTVLEAVPEGIEKADAAQAFAEGVVLGSYQYLRFKGEGEPSKLTRVDVLGRKGARIERALRRGARVAEATTWARDLVNLPSLDKPPEAVVEAAREAMKGTGVRISVWEGDTLVNEHMGGVVGVGQGSSRTPRFMRLTYSPSGARRSIGLVGKGVVFDTGGISIKPAAGMESMKTDMAGAAAVIATMSALKDLDVKHKVVGYVPLVENMPSANAIRPGDVLTHRNGKTVEVINTDAEGRLILADGLSLAAEEDHDAVVDLATLTGACMVALGDKIAGLMGNDDGWIDQVKAAAERAGEKVWPLPLPDEYHKELDSEVADLRNVGNRYGGALTAGLFLKDFAGDKPWVHLDIAGPARATSDDDYVTKGGTGFGVRTLLELVSTFRKP